MGLILASCIGILSGDTRKLKECLPFYDIKNQPDNPGAQSIPLYGYFILGISWIFALSSQLSLLFLLWLSIGIYISYIDFKSSFIALEALAMLFLVSIAYILLYGFSYYVIILPVFFLCLGEIMQQLLHKKIIGMGDILLSFLCGVCIKNYYDFSLFLLIVGYMGYLTAMLTKKEQFPFAPSMIAASWACNIISFG